MKKLISLLVITTLFVMILTGCGGQSSSSETSDVITLKLADSYPSGHTMNITSKYFVDRVEELSNGKIKVEYYPSEQLGKLKDMLQLASSGIVDITPVIPSFFAGQLPLNTVTILPFYTTSTEGMNIYKQLMKEVPEIEQEFVKYGTKVLFVTSTNQYDIGTVEKPIHSPEDLKGLKLKSSGGIFDKIAERYGISPVSLPGTDTYEATEKGILDGNIMTYTSAKGYRISELEKFHTSGARLGGAVTTYVINQNSWGEIPEDLQKILLQVGEETSAFSAELWDKGEEEIMNEFKEEGMTIYTIKEEDREKWDAPLKGIEKEWIKDMNEKGLPGQKVFDEFYNISKEITQ